MSNRLAIQPKALGLIGIGKIAHDQHLPAIASEGRFNLVAKASRDRDAHSDVEYASLSELLEGAPHVAAISLASPPQGRAALAYQALQAGKHVMLEKPPCATLSEARAIEALARQQSLALFASWHSREAAGVAAAREWLADKQVATVQIWWREDVRVWHPGQEWIFANGGMGVFDPAINALSILTDILPGSVSVRAAELEVPANRQSPIRAEVAMLYDLAAPVIARFDFLFEGAPEWTIKIHTDHGILQLDEGGARLAIDGRCYEAGENREYRRLYRKFADLIETRAIDFDLRPLELVADAMLVGERRTTQPFNF